MTEIETTTTTRRTQWIAAASITALIAFTASAFSPITAPEPPAYRWQEQELPIGNIPPPRHDDHIFVHELSIEKQDTMARLLYRAGLYEPDVLLHLQTDRESSQASRNLRPGQSVRVKTRSDGSLQQLAIPLSSSDQPLLITRSSEGLVSGKASDLPEIELSYKSGVIESSLFGSTEKASVPDSIAIQLAEVFSGDIDFHRDIRQGDRFAVVYETLQSEGFSSGTGTVIAAEFVNAGKAHRALRFVDEKGRAGYYDPQGRSMKRAFLRSPLEFSRITSRFSGSRFHPVLQRWRKHTGVDYGAPPGTPVRSTANGTVDFAGRQGGYGNLVVIRHTGNRQTAYGHLRAFAKGLRRGQSVEQGQTIGYVGQTGLASGPHLHYEFRVGGRAVNPLTATIPAAPPLGARQLELFYPVAEEASHQLKIAAGFGDITSD